jgi:hypothetical protein
MRVIAAILVLLSVGFTAARAADVSFDGTRSYAIGERAGPIVIYDYQPVSSCARTGNRRGAIVTIFRAPANGRRSAARKIFQRHVCTTCRRRLSGGPGRLFRLSLSRS